MNDDQKLALLDRRAAAAAAALDEAVQQVPIPDPGFGTTRRSVRRFLPLAVAAGLAVIALVGAALVFDDDEQSTIADQPGAITRLALPDPEALGYRIVGAFDSASAPAPPPGLDLTMTVQTPVDADEPWETTVVSWAVPAELSTLDGETVDVGGPVAALRTEGAVVSVGWRDGKDIRYVRSAYATAGELVALVRRAVDARITTERALPGHRILHTGPYTDVYPAAAIGVTTGDLGGIAYESNDRVLVVATTAGSDARWKAASALAVDVERLTVRGRDAIRADFGEGMTEISWLEADGTLARASWDSGEVPVDVLEQLEPISGADFAAIVDEYGTVNAGVEPPVEGVGEAIEPPEPIVPGDEALPLPPTTVDDRQRMAQVNTEEGSVRIRATLLRAADRAGGREGFYVEINARGTRGSTGAGQSVPDLATNVVLRDRLSSGGWSGVLIGGVIGPDTGPLRILDAETGDEIEANGPSTATIEASVYVLFLATVDDEYSDRDLLVVGTTDAGEEIRLSAPAQP